MILPLTKGMLEFTHDLDHSPSHEVREGRWFPAALLIACVLVIALSNVLFGERPHIVADTLVVKDRSPMYPEHVGLFYGDADPMASDEHLAIDIDDERRTITVRVSISRWPWAMEHRGSSSGC